MDKLQAWEDKFNECLGIELNDPEYFKVHHLLVLTYMLQTNRYTDGYLREALVMLETILASTLVIDHKTTLFLNRKYSSATRTGRIFKPAKRRDVIDWNKTILDIRLDSAQHYQNDVSEWASHVLQVIRQELVDQ